jgi:regulator of sigma E protease
VNYFVAFLIIAILYMSSGFIDYRTSKIEVVPNGPAAAAGLRSGDQVVAVDDHPIRSIDELRHELQKAGTPPERRIEVLRDGAAKTFSVRPDNGFISVRPDQSLIRLPVGRAIPGAVLAVWIINAQQISALWDLAHGRGGASLSGPVAIVKQASAEVKRGVADFAQVVAIISVGLALFNFLPVPALDGGRLVFLGYELITRRKVNEKVESTVHVVGMLLLLALFVVVVVFGDLGLGRRIFSRG